MKRRQLILMRHATADPGLGNDRDRMLTDAGQDDAHRVGSWLAGEGIIPTRILSSSALRCRQTHEALVAGLGLGLEIPVQFEDRLYNAPAEVLLDCLMDLSADAADESSAVPSEVAVLIAHNPGISHLALELAKPDDAPQLRKGFSPAITAAFELLGDWASLRRESVRLIRFTNVREI